jgi:hypothetical protein
MPREAVARTFAVLAMRGAGKIHTGAVLTE